MQKISYDAKVGVRSTEQYLIRVPKQYVKDFNLINKDVKVTLEFEQKENKEKS